MLPPEILVRGGRYIFPPRKIGAVRLLGCLPIGFGLIFSTFALVWSIAALRAEPWMAGFGIPFIIAGLVPIGFGMIILFGHHEIELSQHLIRSIERAGPARWSRSRPVRSVTRVEAGAVKMNYRETRFGWLRIHAPPAQPLTVAQGYPIEWIRAMAAELSEKLGVEEPSLSEAAEAAPDPEEKPPESNVEIREYRTGLVVNIPPPGKLGLARPLVGMGVFWLLLTGAITLAMALGGSDLPWFIWPFLAIFWAVGIWLLLAGLNMNRRRATIEIDRDSLALTRHSIFGVRRDKWPRAEIADVRTGPSGLEINDKPVIELQIHLVSGKKVGLLGGRSEAELQWIARKVVGTVRSG
jgi:hypothetical protein